MSKVEISNPTTSSDVPVVRSKTLRKLHKPPIVATIHERPRKRLQKRHTAPAPETQLQRQKHAVALFVLEYAPYPEGTKPREFLGVYSTIDTVTAGAFRHGAYTFSKEGLLDGSEYLSPNGRIRIISQAVQRSGPTATTPEKTRSLNGEPVRLDIPHPESRKEETAKPKELVEHKEEIFLAIQQAPRNAFCIGLFSTKSLAWGACLKDKAWLAWSDTLVEEERSIRKNNMPEVSARLVGSGRQSWFVQAYGIDEHRERKDALVTQLSVEQPPIVQATDLPPDVRDV